MLSLDEEREIIENNQKRDAVPAWDRFFYSHSAPQTPRLTSRPGTPDNPPPAPLSRNRWDVSLLSRDQSDASLLSRDQSDVSHLSRCDITLPSLPSPARVSSDSSPLTTPAPIRSSMKSLLYMYSLESVVGGGGWLVEWCVAQFASASIRAGVRVG